MTVIVHIGRRVPRQWFRRQIKKGVGFISFQSNLWLIIQQSINLAKKKANKSGKVIFETFREKESEDINFQIEWIKIVIKGDKEAEKEEYQDCLDFYKPFGKLFKKDVTVDKNMTKHFKSKFVPQHKIDEAYQEGYGAVSDANLANKMLEMGILMHAELIEDYDTREPFFLN